MSPKLDSKRTLGKALPSVGLNDGKTSKAVSPAASPPPIPSDEDEKSDEDPDTVEQDEPDEVKSLDARFTQEQLDYLYSQKDAYRSAPAARRRELSQATGLRFLKEAQAAGRDPSKRDTAALYGNVAEWFAQRARTRKGPMHWEIPWTGRQVFYKENTSLVQESQMRLFSCATDGKAADDSIVNDDDSVEVISRKAKPFDFFQRAVTAEWEALTDVEREEYEQKALVWRERGPTREQRQALAEKEACRSLHQIADGFYRQMGVRLFFLVDMEDTAGEHVALSLDFNSQIDGGTSFKRAERTYLENIDLEGRWAAFIKRQLSNEVKEEVGDDDSIPKTPRKRGDPVDINLNEFNEPIIPDIKAMQSAHKNHRLYPNLIRSIMRHDYACCRGISVSAHSSSPPWKTMVGKIRKFIDAEYWPDDWPEGDPGPFGVKTCETILTYWFDRQQRGEIPFQFHSYWSGENWHPRAPRQKAEDLEDFTKVSRKKRPASKKRRQPEKTAKATAKRKVVIKPTTTARQSATSAISRPTHKRAPVKKAKDHSTPSSSSSSASASDSDSEPPPLPTRRRSQVRVSKANGSKVRVDSSSGHTSSSDGDLESDYDGGRRTIRSSPHTNALVGATSKLTLKTPSREATAMDLDNWDRDSGGEDKGSPTPKSSSQMEKAEVKNRQSGRKRKDLENERQRKEVKGVREEAGTEEGDAEGEPPKAGDRSKGKKKEEQKGRQTHKSRKGEGEGEGEGERKRNGDQDKDGDNESEMGDDRKARKRGQEKDKRDERERKEEDRKEDERRERKREEERKEDERRERKREEERKEDERRERKREEDRKEDERRERKREKERKDDEDRRRKREAERQEDEERKRRMEKEGEDNEEEEDDEQRERDSREKRERLRLEKQSEAKARAEKKRQAKAIPNTEVKGDADLPNVEPSGSTDSKVKGKAEKRKRQSKDKGNAKIQKEDVVEDEDVGVDEKEDKEGEEQDSDEALDSLAGDVVKRRPDVRTIGQGPRGPSRGRQTSASTSRRRRVPQDNPNEADSGASSSSALLAPTNKVQSRQDRLLLEAAQGHIPLSSKRQPKPKVRFGV